jgi:hypothetical protein
MSSQCIDEQWALTETDAELSALPWYSRSANILLQSVYHQELHYLNLKGFCLGVVQH